MPMAKINPFLSFGDLEPIVHAFITALLNYCNFLYVGVNQPSLSYLQVIQNAAQTLLTGTKKRDYISTVLAFLQWLPVNY